MASRYFTGETLTFLRDLAQNNNRDWFETNKSLYEEAVRQPALRFINEMADNLALISPHFLALPRKVGGSLMRVHRDTRFSKDKRPYKTNIGIQFRHEQGRDVHAPGFYVHIEPSACFVGVGVWRPDSSALGKIRDRICEQPHRWQSANNAAAFKQYFEPHGGKLVRPPRGYPREHPLIEDLKRKDFIAVSAVHDKHVLQPGFKQNVLDRFEAARAYMQFLCQALELRY